MNSLLKLKEFRCHKAEDFVALKDDYESLVKHPGFVDQTQKIQRIIENLRDELEKEEGGEKEKRAMIFVARQIQELPFLYIKQGEEADKVIMKFQEEKAKRVKA